MYICSITSDFKENLAFKGLTYARNRKWINIKFLFLEETEI
jgi:hypothetical protein